MTPLLRQHTSSSCGLAALGMLLADLAVSRIDPMNGTAGLYNRELVAAAKGLGIKLQAVRVKRDSTVLDSSRGILCVRWNRGTARAKESPAGHFVMLSHGTIHCSSLHVAQPWRVYLVEHECRPTTLLRVV